MKVLGANNGGSLGAILAGVTYAADQGANIANMSLGGVQPRPGNGVLISLIQRTMNYAKQTVCSRRWAPARRHRTCRGSLPC